MQATSHKSPMHTRSRLHATIFFCLQGSVQVHAPDTTLTLRPGDLAIAPVGAEIENGEDGLILPFSVEGLSGASRTIALGQQWGAVMVDAYVNHLSGGISHHGIFEQLLKGLVVAPRLPKPRPALNVARAIISRPSAATSLNQFATQQHVASRTLQRQFESSTGLSFSEWRAAYRVYVAADMLRNGVTLDHAASAVGFGATSSLSRAFIRHTGTSPGKAVRERDRAMPQVMGRAIAPLSDIDHAFWIYCGTATVTAPDYCRFAASGDVVSLLSGTGMQLEVAAGSVAIPIPAGLGREVTDLADALTLCEELFRGENKDPDSIVTA